MNTKTEATVRDLTTSVGRRTLILCAVASLCYGLAAGYSMGDVPSAARPDRALLVAALAAFVTPLWLLDLLSTPRRGPIRRALGEPASRILKGSTREATAVVMAMMCAPLGIGLWAMVGGDNVDDLWRMAAIVGCGVGSVGAVAIWCLLSALEQIAAGLPPSWRSVSGGGAFGPVETAPLLYAPAFALVAGLVPVGLLTAVWGAKPELLSPIIASAAAVLVIAVGSVLATRQVTRTRRFAQRAQLVIEQAHATRFAMDECLPKAPGWLRLAALSGSGRVSRAAFDLFSAAWIRRFPASAVATAALTMVALLCVEPTDGPLIIGLVALAISLYSSTRADRLSVAEPKLDAAARWLGASEHVLRAGRTRLGAGLCLPAVVLIAIAVDTDAWLAVLAGALIGAITGLTLVGQLRPGGAVSWLGRSALVVALIATVWSSPNPPSGESERAPAAARRTS